MYKVVVGLISKQLTCLEQAAKGMNGSITVGRIRVIKQMPHIEPVVPKVGVENLCGSKKTNKLGF